MPRHKARVHVLPKRAVLDPQGKAVLQSLHSLGFAGVKDVRVGKLIELEIEGESSEVEAGLKDMCEKLLANTVIEDYRFELV